MGALTDSLENNPLVNTMVSCLLGFGLATVFRRMCLSDDCSVVRGPSEASTEKYRYMVAPGQCYQYRRVPVECAHKTNGA